MSLAFHPTIISEPSSTDFLITNDDDNNNKNAATTTTSYVYYHKQPDYLQIIQLVECPAPPPPAAAQISSDHIPSSYYDSTECSSSDEEEEFEDEEEELCSSYCSSDEEELECPPQSSEAFVRPPFSPEADDIRMKRILAWRENFSAAMSPTLSDSSTTTTAAAVASTATSLKRKFPGDYREEDHDEIMSHSSKRSRLSDDESSSVSSFGEHSCPACDATFPTRQSLRQHGLDAAKSNEACSVAVEYAFE